MTKDLTQRPPRSPRVRIGGYAILGRIIDKCRAVLAGKQGDYKYACPLDQQFFTFAGIDPEAFKVQVSAGKGDGELLTWVEANAKHPRTASEIEAWSTHQDQRGPMDHESREFYNGVHKEVAPHREDLSSWFDLLDVDDEASYGGKV